MKKVQHMVVVRFKRGVSEDTIAGLFRELGELRKKIAGIEHFAWGPYASPEGMNRGFTHGFLMTFRDAESRDRYLPHPAHERVKQAILPHVENVIVFDCEK